MKASVIEIEDIQLKIGELQKRIKINYSKINTEDLDDKDFVGISEEIKQLNDQINLLQLQLRERYRNMSVKKSPAKELQWY